VVGSHAEPDLGDVQGDPFADEGVLGARAHVAEGSQKDYTFQRKHFQLDP
jgi:hypothetical protein